MGFSSVACSVSCSAFGLLTIFIDDWSVKKWNVFGASYEYRAKYNEYRARRNEENRIKRKAGVDEKQMTWKEVIK